MHMAVKMLKCVVHDVTPQEHSDGGKQQIIADQDPTESIHDKQHNKRSLRNQPGDNAPPSKRAGGLTLPGQLHHTDTSPSSPPRGGILGGGPRKKWRQKMEANPNG